MEFFKPGITNAPVLPALSLLYSNNPLEPYCLKIFFMVDIFLLTRQFDK
jgi:hypothetical protein